ncbi:MAG: YkoF family thiamine/hydroxymethylpyrimidine-binding protein [Bacillota bacterium]
MSTRPGRCLIAYHPLKVSNYGQKVEELLNQFHPGELAMDTGSMSSTLQGPSDEIWDKVRELYSLAEKQGGEFILDISFTNHTE